MKAFVEGTFGPVVSVYPVATEEEAIDAANATCYGVSASIWTGDSRRGARLAQSIRAGSVNVNEAYAAAWATVDSPIGGMKESGLRPSRRRRDAQVHRITDDRGTEGFPIAPSEGMSPEFFARWMSRLLKLLRRVPGLR
jgi:acyl-CoA reductase-like NAD-dependent aldehyde dehydrogenase